MRLVIVFQDTDDCTYSCECVIPVEYCSAEQFAVDHEEQCLNAVKNNKFEFILANKVFNTSNFMSDVYYGPRILTIDEWFKE